MNQNSTYTYIGCNKYQFYGKFFVIILFLSPLVLIPTSPHSSKNDTNNPAFLIILLSLICLLLLFMFILMILELLFLTNGIEIDFKKKNILMKYFLMKSETIELSNIIQYSETTISTKSSSYICYLIYTKNKRKYLLGDFNLQEYLPIKSFLDDNSTKFIGHEKTSMVTYFINYFRFKN